MTLITSPPWLSFFLIVREHYNMVLIFCSTLDFILDLHNQSTRSEANKNSDGDTEGRG